MTGPLQLVVKRPLFTAVLVFIVALCPRSSFAFPVYLTSNGTTLVNSAFGSNVVLGPDAGGQVLASALLNATSGIALNSTLLNEPLVQGLLAQISTLTPPNCSPPGGAQLSYNNGVWTCLCNVGWSGSSCTQLVYNSAPLYDPRIPITLTSCGVQGASGPSLLDCQKAYSSQVWASQVLPSYYTYGNPAGSTAPWPSWQVLTLPVAGVYSITAAGASNAVPQYTWPLSTNMPSSVCRGAVMTANFTVSANTSMFVKVGQAAGLVVNGAGGSFVTLGDGTLLLAAGGGGGYSGQQAMNTLPSCDASLTSTSGLTGQCSGGGAGGSSGGAGANGPAGGGAGFAGNATAGANVIAPAALAGGAVGDMCLDGYFTHTPGGSCPWGVPGGFGGGGVGFQALGGGGGGYSGGGGGGSNQYQCGGGGGGSYCQPSPFLPGNCASGYNIGAGYVKIAFQK